MRLQLFCLTARMGLARRIRLRFRGRVHVVVVVVRCGGDEHSPPFAGGGAKLGTGCPIRAVHEITCASQIRNGWPLVNASHPLRAGVVVVVGGGVPQNSK